VHGIWVGGDGVLHSFPGVWITQRVPRPTYRSCEVGTDKPKNKELCSVCHPGDVSDIGGLRSFSFPSANLADCA
jgi:hypothetical protein